MSGAPALRLDKWLWHARFIRNRNLAEALVAARRVRLNEQIVGKTHQLVRPGRRDHPDRAGAGAGACGSGRWASAADPPIEARQLYEELTRLD